jgi:polyribonucleotide nucleotidyltransferase
MDKIGEVIGPKGKVINTIQQETGADIAVDDDGAQGFVTVGAVEAWRMEEALQAIRNIVSPPMAEIGKTYKGRVVNITKFGAFVNILPGRDGLVHISKLGGGKRIDKVEDVLDLGDTLEVKVDDVDPNGKVSLSPVSPLGGGSDDSSGDAGGRSSGGRSSERSESGGGRASSATATAEAPASGGSAPEVVSFEDAFDAELREEFGDLGPPSDAPREDSGAPRGRSGGARRGGGRQGGGGRGRR